MASLKKALIFVRDVRLEMNKVTWPGFKETRGMSLMVLVLVVLIAGFLVLTDSVLRSALSAILGV